MFKITPKRLNMIIGQFEGEMTSKYSMDKNAFSTNDDDAIFTPQSRRKASLKLIQHYSIEKLNKLSNQSHFKRNYYNDIDNIDSILFRGFDNVGTACGYKQGISLYGISSQKFIKFRPFNKTTSNTQAQKNSITPAVSYMVNDPDLENSLIDNLKNYPKALDGFGDQQITSTDDYRKWITANLVIKLIYSYFEDLCAVTAYASDVFDSEKYEIFTTELNKTEEIFFQKESFNYDLEKLILNHSGYSDYFSKSDLKLWEYSLLRIDTTPEWIEQAYAFQRSLTTIKTEDLPYLGKYSTWVSSNYTQTNCTEDPTTLYGVPLNYLINQNLIEDVLSELSTQTSEDIEVLSAYKQYVSLSYSVLPTSVDLQSSPGNFLVSLEKDFNNKISILIFTKGNLQKFEISSELTEDQFTDEMHTALELTLESDGDE